MPRFRYSLRTLFIVLTIIAAALGAYIVPQMRIVQKRKELLKGIPVIPVGKGGTLGLNRDTQSIPIIREWLGDEAIDYVWVPARSVAEYREWFPEAEIVVGNIMENIEPETERQ